MDYRIWTWKNRLLPVSTCISGYLIGIGGVALGGGIWTIGGAGEWRWTSPDGDGHELDIRPEVFDTRSDVVVYIGGITDWSGVVW